MGTSRAVICSLSDSTTFFPHYVINGMIFENKFIENKMCVLILPTTFVQNISHSKYNSAG